MTKKKVSKKKKTEKVTKRKKTSSGKSRFNSSKKVNIEKQIEKSVSTISKIKGEIRKAVIGQDKVVNELMICILCSGNALLEGVPGIAKTLIMKSFATAIGCDSKRIQFTADLLPTDITGFVAYSREKGFFVVKGPIFSNFVLADEINRAPPKVQSALIEVMQEKQVTIGKKTFFLKEPFIVIATENPLENRGVYKLPEAQIDRFLFKIMVDYPTSYEESFIIDTNVTLRKFEDYGLKAVTNAKEIIKIQNLVKEIFVHDKIKDYIIRIVEATRPRSKTKFKSFKYIAWGASPRASINIYYAARANALLNRRSFVTPQDIKDVASNVLRHRILLNYQGQIDNVSTDDIVKEILEKIKVP